MGQQSKQRCPMSYVQFYSTYIHFFNRLTKVTEEQEHFPANHQSITGPRQRDSQPFNVTVTKDSFQMSEATMLTTSTTVLDTRYCCKYTTIAKADNETKYNNNVHCDQNSISTHKPPPAPPTHTNSFLTTPSPSLS